jgi:hypothetical protein
MIVKIKLKVYGLLISLFYGEKRIIEQNGLFSRNFIISYLYFLWVVPIMALHKKLLKQI